MTRYFLKELYGCYEGREHYGGAWDDGRGYGRKGDMKRYPLWRFLPRTDEGRRK